MKAVKIIFSGLAGTSVMTLFSYIVSEAEEINFKEPELLADLLKDALKKNELTLPAGWVTHYIMGISWAAVFEYLFERTRIKRDFKTGVFLGGLSGLTGSLSGNWFLNLIQIPHPLTIKGFTDIYY